MCMNGIGDTQNLLYCRQRVVGTAIGVDLAMQEIRTHTPINTLQPIPANHRGKQSIGIGMGRFGLGIDCYTCFTPL